MQIAAGQLPFVGILLFFWSRLMCLRKSDQNRVGFHLIYVINFPNRFLELKTVSLSFYRMEIKQTYEPLC